MSLWLTMSISECPWQGQVSWWCSDVLEVGILFAAATLLTSVLLLVFGHSLIAK